MYKHFRRFISRVDKHVFQYQNSLRSELMPINRYNPFNDFKI